MKKIEFYMPIYETLNGREYFYGEIFTTVESALEDVRNTLPNLQSKKVRIENLYCYVPDDTPGGVLDDMLKCK